MDGTALVGALQSVEEYPQQEMAIVDSDFNWVANWGKNNNRPIFMGEFGVGSPADGTSRCNYVEKITHFSDSLSFPWTYWDVRNYGDSFGIYPNGIMSEPNVITCFKTSMDLYVTPLPLMELSSLEAKCEESSVRFNWKSNVYENGGLFIVEKSQNGKEWQAVQNTKANTDRIDYEAVAMVSSKEKYYRLAYIAKDGSIDYSEIMTTDCYKNETLSVFPNPISANEFSLDFTSMNAQDIHVTLYSMNGQVVFNEKMSVLKGKNTLPIAVNNLPKGFYQLHLVTEGGNVMAVKIVKD